jgi:hypothetical protein
MSKITSKIKILKEILEQEEAKLHQPKIYLFDEQGNDLYPGTNPTTTPRDTDIVVRICLATKETV